jgi:hypothetical protein
VLTWYKSLRPLGIAVLVGAVAFGVVFGPLLVLDEITVDQHSVEQRTGFWFSPTRKGFTFAELRRIRIASVGKSSVAQEVWRLELVDGTTRDLDPGDLWDLHRDEIIRAVEAQGIVVVR